MNTKVNIATRCAAPNGRKSQGTIWMIDERSKRTYIKLKMTKGKCNNKMEDDFPTHLK